MKARLEETSIQHRGVILTSETEEEKKSLDVQLAELLLTLTPDRLRDVLGADAKRQRENVVHLVRRRLITVHQRCVTCDTMSVWTTLLNRGEEVSVIQKGNKVTTVRYTVNHTPLLLQSEVSKCNSCLGCMKKWSREKLEAKFEQLLNRLISQTKDGFV